MGKSKLYEYDIDKWEDEFADIYYETVDKYRTPAEMWLFLVQDASKVAEFIRREKYAEALKALTHVLNWTCSFVRRCRNENDLKFKIDK